MSAGEVLSSIFTWDNMRFLFNGLKVTATVAVWAIVLSFIFGTFLGVARRYDRKGIIGRFAAVYIEIFRNTPNLLWIMAIRFMVPVPALYSGILSFTLFTTAVVAEIVRGGLNAIPRGQFEACYSQGFTFGQALFLVVLPQCYRSIVPSLLSQVITIIKDTSFLWAVSIEEFTGKGMILMGSFRTSAQVFTLFAFMAMVYFSINFTLSLLVRRWRGSTAGA